MILPDPPVRPDGLCATCLRERKHAKPNKYSGDQAVNDPFCSTACCRVWHDNPLPAAESGGRTRIYEAQR